MAKRETFCPKCKRNSRTVEVRRSTLLGGSLSIRLTCGHSIFRKETVDDNFVERDEKWSALFPYQREGVEFFEQAGFRALCADAPGLGKTIQALVTIRYHRDLCPVLYVVKSNLRVQWREQMNKWLFDEKDPFFAMSQIVDTAHSVLLPVNHTIISMDMLEPMKEKIIERGFKTIVIDESHNFKTMDAARTTALFEIVSAINPTGILCLSGTPVLNRADEFFSTLNLIRPELWRSYEGFKRDWAPSGGIHPRKVEAFHALTKHYIIRREKRDVLTDLPPFRRNYEWIEIEDARLKDAYNSQLKKLAHHLTMMDNLRANAQNQMALLGYLEKMRQVCALAKIPWTIEYIESFLTLQEGEKIMVGLHHDIAIQCLSEALEPWRPIIITGKQSADEKEKRKQEFIRDPQRRIMICSIQACGEGMDGVQHVCSNMLFLERQWNLAKEHQFECRLDRIGQTKPVSVTHLLAKKTVDEYFTELILEKEKGVLTTVQGADINAELERHASTLNYRDLAERCLGSYL
jgi:SNF2 family DNA or RNA helicase